MTGRKLAPDELPGYIFGRAARDVFRLETHQTLTVGSSEDRTRRWLAGEDPGPRPWLDAIREQVAAGLITRRVLTIDPPGPTDYMRAAIDWGYLGNVEAGERCRVIERAGARVNVGRQDFWLIDDTDVVLMHYTAGGDIIGGELVGDPADVGRWRALARAAWDAATDLTDWWGAHPEHWRESVPNPRSDHDRHDDRTPARRTA